MKNPWRGCRPTVNGGLSMPESYCRNGKDVLASKKELPRRRKRGMTAWAVGQHQARKLAVCAGIIVLAIMTTREGVCSDVSDVTNVTLDLTVNGDLQGPEVVWEQRKVTPDSMDLGVMTIKIPKPTAGKGYAIMLYGPSILTSEGYTKFTGDIANIENVRQEPVSEGWKKDTSAAQGPQYKMETGTQYRDLKINFFINEYTSLVPGKYTATMKVQYMEF
ncbi:hypothetical protein ABKZ63_005453 [Salmonella enterica]